MKRISNNQLEKVRGSYSYTQHLGCALLGAAVGGGFGSAATYLGCLMTLDNKPWGSW